MLNIKIEKTTAPKEKPKKGEALKFGHIFTDHMFVMNYTEGKGWHDACVVPALSLGVVHDEHVVGEDLAEAQLLARCGLGLGIGGFGNFDIKHDSCSLR